MARSHALLRLEAKAAVEVSGAVKMVLSEKGLISSRKYCHIEWIWSILCRRNEEIARNFEAMGWKTPLQICIRLPDATFRCGYQHRVDGKKRGMGRWAVGWYVMLLSSEARLIPVFCGKLNRSWIDCESIGSWILETIPVHLAFGFKHLRPGMVNQSWLLKTPEAGQTIRSNTAALFLERNIFAIWSPWLLRKKEREGEKLSAWKWKSYRRHLFLEDVFQGVVAARHFQLRDWSAATGDLLQHFPRVYEIKPRGLILDPFHSRGKEAQCLYASTLDSKEVLRPEHGIAEQRWQNVESSVKVTDGQGSRMVSQTRVVLRCVSTVNVWPVSVLPVASLPCRLRDDVQTALLQDSDTLLATWLHRAVLNTFSGSIQTDTTVGLPTFGAPMRMSGKNMNCKSCKEEFLSCGFYGDGRGEFRYVFIDPLIIDSWVPNMLQNDI